MVSPSKFLSVLLCPLCAGRQRLIAVIEDDEAVQRILRHLTLCEERRRLIRRVAKLRRGIGLLRLRFVR